MTRPQKSLESGIMATRIQRLRELLARENLPSLLVSSPPNVRYLCGFSGSNGILLVTRKSAWFFTDFRYQEQMKYQVHGCRKQMLKRDLFTDFPQEYIRGADRLGFEESHITVARYKMLKRRLKRVRLVGTKDLVIGLRRTKDKGEAALIRRAQRITEEAFRWALENARPGVRERDLAAGIENLFRQQGECAFPSIVASGPNAALPHAKPSDRQLRKGDVITFDIGCKYEGYCSDMTRTVFLGRPDPDLAQVYSIVLEAQRRALAAVRPTAMCADVDAAARNYIKDMGYGKYFGHGVGHGVGLEVHEQPGLSFAARDALAPGDIVTVEPGIYLPGLGGVRIEDMVLVTKTGHENLTRSPKKLIVL